MWLSAVGFVVKSTAVEKQEPITGFYLTRLGQVGDMSINQFQFNPGAEVPEHAHEQAQIGYIIQGELTQTVNDEEYVLSSGDAYFLRSNDRHSGTNNGEEDVIGIDIFNPPRQAPNWIK